VGEVLELEQTVANGQFSFAVVHIQAWDERDTRNDRSINVYQSQPRMLGKDMAAACLAPLPIALRRFAKGSNIFFSPRNSHVFRLPQGKGINGSRRPMAARIAMTIAHADRRAGQGELNRPTETTSIVAFWTGHNGIPNWLQDTRRWVLLTVQHSNLARRAGTNANQARSMLAQLRGNLSER
jgi:hypothetical protein